jgi:putative phosphoesterase
MSDAQVLARIGVISDTHFQDRLFVLPEQLARVWGPVDLILHAGDVGDLSVLDKLGQIAPVVAVHGNDEPETTRRDLPEQQLLMLAGARVLLWHSHFPDPVVEQANRKGNWGPKLDRLAARGREVGAQIVVYGHTHVPSINQYDDVILYNPGAVASGTIFKRQSPQTLGRLRVLAGGAIEVEHLDLATGQVLALPAPDPADDFDVLGGRYQTWMIEPDLVPLTSELRWIPYENMRSFLQAIFPVYRRRFEGGLVSRQDLIEAVRGNPLVTENDQQKVLAVLERR